MRQQLAARQREAHAVDGRARRRRPCAGRSPAAAVHAGVAIGPRAHVPSPARNAGLHPRAAPPGASAAAAGDALREQRAPAPGSTAPSSARQYSVARITVSCSQVKTPAPTTGPASVCTPPSSTITSPSTDRPTEIASGEIDPFANANSAPARPQNRPATANAIQLHAHDVDADRLGAQRRIATGAHRVAERREQHPPQQIQTRADERRGSGSSRPSSKPKRSRRPDADQAVAAAGDLVPLEHDRPDDLRERERQHREVDAGQAHREPAEQQRAGQRHDAGRRPARPPSAATPRAAAAPRHRRRARSRRHGRRSACRPGP